ncbi:hypothetical protein DEIPH_ctg020orf0010 [Deinococcus phoenicis]|uniref:Sodium/calcium exchanger membrane region domain-containing protein n=1 Tax=Deinococcus phoenicis TaxID=1476583 RepID=A0A016QR40_9DEIO|nr:sodium:proton exchanger [Deinococcus phoenicis]EYB68575.1 hypothetical protein DEIPH_ctg020orf0010 [Deinococcus phoenicis]
MFTTLSVPLLLLVFGLAAGAVWVAGVRLSGATDVLGDRLRLGEALGGLILLAVATNLPEIAITVSASVQGHLDLAIGNILGGIAVQTVVLAVLDAFGLGRHAPLTSESRSLNLVLEGSLVTAVLMAVLMGAQLPKAAVWGRLEPAALLVALLWGVGLWLIGRARALPWRPEGPPPTLPPGVQQARRQQDARKQSTSTARAALVFAVAALVTLGAGLVLALSGEALARHLHMSGVLFGATVLSLATALPEISTGLASVRLGDYELAVSDIFGGNAFLPVLFLLASLVSGQAVLPQLQPSDLYLTALGVLLTAVYLYGLVFRSRRQWGLLGLDSWAVLGLYGLGLLGLWLLARPPG